MRVPAPPHHKQKIARSVRCLGTELHSPCHCHADHSTIICSNINDGIAFTASTFFSAVAPDAFVSVQLVVVMHSRAGFDRFKMLMGRCAQNGETAHDVHRPS